MNIFVLSTSLWLISALRNIEFLRNSFVCLVFLLQRLILYGDCVYTILFAKMLSPVKTFSQHRRCCIFVTQIPTIKLHSHREWIFLYCQHPYVDLCTKKRLNPYLSDGTADGILSSNLCSCYKDLIPDGDCLYSIFLW